MLNRDDNWFKKEMDGLVVELIDAIGRVREIQKKASAPDLKLHAGYAEGRVRYVAEKLAEMGIDAREHLARLGKKSG